MSWAAGVVLLAVSVANSGPAAAPIGVLAGVPVAVDAAGSAGIGAGVPSAGVEGAPVTSGCEVGVVGVVGVVGGVGVAGAVVAGPGVTAQVEADVAGESGVAVG